jgi:hypothetical protein
VLFLNTLVSFSTRERRCLFHIPDLPMKVSTANCSNPELLESDQKKNPHFPSLIEGNICKVNLAIHQNGQRRVLSETTLFSYRLSGKSEIALLGFFIVHNTFLYVFDLQTLPLRLKSTKKSL